MSELRTDLIEKYPYIVIEGPIGCGKTTLARKLAERYQVNLLLENAEANPFLSRFYQDAPRYALPTQLFFLFQRVNQIRDIGQRDMFTRATICRFFLEKDLIFARLNLDQEEYALYHQMYQHLQIQATKPDLVIYLQTPVAALAERIEQRNISYEQDISRDYLARLANAYSEFFHQYEGSPLLIVNNDKLNIAEDDAALDLLIERMMQIRGQREYFNLILINTHCMNLLKLQQMAQCDEKIAVLTSYDASFAMLCDQAGVDVLLVGDSLGMVLQGADSTLAVSMHDMQYHTRCVAKGANKAYIITDMPFGSYQQNPEQALRNAIRLMAAGAHMVKLEGGAVMCETVRFLVERGLPVCGHLGLTPQSVHQLGGYRVQGKTEAAAEQLMQDAQALSEAGAGLLVLEMVPASLAKQITLALSIPTIGIGAGADCSGQVLVLHDMLGIYSGHNPEYKAPRFVRNFMQGAESIQQALEAYVNAVKSREFPAPEHSY